jgi:Tfp pilus assembly protein PilV
MTLMELLIALVITGMALAAGYGALATVIDRRMQSNSEVDEVVRASTVRRTLVNWLQHGQIQFMTGGIAAQGQSKFGSESDELRFVTTASTALRSDSTTVDLYVYPPDPSGLGDFSTPHGLVAILTPTSSAMAGMQTATGASAPLGSGMSGTGSGYGLPGDKYYSSGPMIVQLDANVATLRVDYLVKRADSVEVWIPSSTFSTSNNATTHDVTLNGATIVALRLTLLPGNSTMLQPMLGLPIVVPMFSKR